MLAVMKRVWPLGWSSLLALVLLGPALGPGYVLSYDMAWVPHLDLRPDLVGLGSAVPRGVPSDAVVAVLDDVVPAALLQKLVLLLPLVLGGVGTAALLDDVRGGVPAAARAAAVTWFVWNPFVVERLVIGHWPLLICYGVAPWLVRSVSRWRTQHDGARRGWWLLVVLGSLSASAGILTAAVVAVFGLRRRQSLRERGELAGVVLAANLPWLVAGASHAAAAVVDPRSADVFALSDEGLLPGPLAAVVLGGIWNAEVVPGSRSGVLAVVGFVVMVALAILGARRLTDVPDRARLLVLWSLGFLGAVVTWAAPGPLGAVAAEVPGAGVMRDGARLLLLCAPLTTVLVALGTREVAAWWPVGWQRALVAGSLVVWPVTLMPDAAWGVAGRLQAATYPDGYAAARSLVDAEETVAVLPFSSYRAPAWNQRHPVLDPMGRFLRADTIVNDALSVDGEALRGEDPRAASVAQALTASDPVRELRELGVSIVVVDAPLSPDESAVVDLLAEEEVGKDAQVRVLRTGLVEPEEPRADHLVVLLGWVVWGLLCLAALVVWSARLARPRVRRDATS